VKQAKLKAWIEYHGSSRCHPPSAVAADPSSRLVGGS
jgi:hypothetical protein